MVSSFISAVLNYYMPFPITISNMGLYKNFLRSYLLYPNSNFFKKSSMSCGYGIQGVLLVAITTEITDVTQWYFHWKGLF